MGEDLTIAVFVYSIKLLNAIPPTRQRTYKNPMQVCGCKRIDCLIRSWAIGIMGFDQIKVVFEFWIKTKRVFRRFYNYRKTRAELTRNDKRLVQS